MDKSILVTGGCGYIGSHTVVELINAGYQAVIYDNLCNSQLAVLERIQRITGVRPIFVNGDIRDGKLIADTLRQYSCSSVIHFAGLKAVGESSQIPVEYYDNNVAGTIKLLQAMQSCQVKKIIFSSSATVYGVVEQLPLQENAPLSTTNPYGRSKLIIEDILRDLYCAENDWQITLLRYFNPIGAHASGLIGEDPRGVPNNLLPFVAQVAVKKRQLLNIWGNDYPTADGTCIRDYIHVVDLALGHLQALRQINTPQCIAINLGTGIGYSVLEVVNTFARVSGQEIPYQIASRRPGDLAVLYADASLAWEKLHWRAQANLEQMCADTWHWQQGNPNGY